MITVQAGKTVAASAWKDNKVVTAMYSGYNPSQHATVLRRQKDGTRSPVTCPVAIAYYNQFMGGVDRGDQIRGYYATKIKSRKFYKYIVNFLVGVAIFNAYIFYRHATQNGATSLKKFHELVAIQLIGDYCSRKKPGRISYLVKPLPITHFPQKRHDSPGTKRGRCVVCQEKKQRRDTPWFCSSCGVWLCHQGSSTDCFHKKTL